MPPESQQSVEGRPETTGLPRFAAPGRTPPRSDFGAWWSGFRSEFRRTLSYVADPKHSARTLERLIAIEIPALFLLLAHDYARQRHAAIWPLAALEALLLLILLLNRRGFGVVAGRIFCVGNWALASWFLLAGDPASAHAALLALPAVLLATGLLLNLRLLFGVALLMVATVVGMVTVEHSEWGWIRTGPSRTHAESLDALIVIGFSIVSVGLFTRDICEALRRAREQEEKLEVSTAELRRQADTLQGNAQKLQMAMELAVEGVVHADSAGRIADANTRAGEITGHAREELIGRSFMEFFGRDELDRNPPRWDALEQGRSVTAERYLTRKDGSRILVEMTSQRLPDRTLQCFVRDITNRRAEEDASRQRQRLEALGTLAGGIAHDFNNLLTVMHGALDVLAARPDAGPVPMPLQDLRTAIEQANLLTRQLLAFARKQALDRRQVDLRRAVEQNARMLHRLLGPQIELVVSLDEQPCPVFADVGALAQVFTNLAVNARDAMSKTGRLEIGCHSVDGIRPPANNTAVAPSGRYVRVRVVDTGCGMTEEVQRRIFEPFFTTKGKEQGTGLGLSVSLGIIEQHGGWIEVASEVGRGSEFRVFLPRQELLVASAPAAPAPPIPSIHGTETILLVEDEEPVRRLTAGALAMCGFKVIEAGTGAEVLKRWPEIGESVHMLLTDVAMPGGVNGVELAQALRARRPTLPIMITSGHNQEEVSFGDGCWDDIRFLPKPFTMAALTRMARETLDSPVVPGAH
jgi:PAS domain S-box-containing protein